MRGTLMNNKNKWVVVYAPIIDSGAERWPVTLPIHTDDEKLINEKYGKSNERFHRIDFELDQNEMCARVNNL